MEQRIAKIERKTRETDISIELNLDGQGKYTVDTGVPFLDHMLELFCKHALLDATIKASGDTEVDDHHTVEDVGLVLGEALNQALGQRLGICRYGHFLLPMDETLCRVALDLGGRAFLVYNIAHPQKRIRDFELSLLEDFFQAMTSKARMNLHIEQLYGRDAHHAHESVFKCVARALRGAMELDPRAQGMVPSSKGVL